MAEACTSISTQRVSEVYQPGLMEIRDTVTSFNLFISDLGREIFTFFRVTKHDFQTHVGLFELFSLMSFNFPT